MRRRTAAAARDTETHCKYRVPGKKGRKKKAKRRVERKKEEKEKRGKTIVPGT
jgi:hypothetical protein